MDVRNCKRCKKLIDFNGSSLCPACEKEMEDKFFEVRKYIMDNPTATMPTVAEENQVPIQQIKKWIKEERLSFTKASGMSFSCEKCGRAILTGRYCSECKKSVTNTFSALYAEPEVVREKKKAENAKMRFLNS